MKSRTVLSLFLLPFLFGCVSSLKIIQEIPDDSFPEGGRIKEKTAVRVFVTSVVNVMEFRKSFKKEYDTPELFAETLRNDIAGTLQTALGCVAHPGETPDASVISSGAYNSADMAKIDEVFGKAAEEHFLVITKTEITSKSSPGGSSVMVGGGGMMVGTGGGSESCVVTLHVQVWDTKLRKKVSAFAAVGEAKVHLFFYGTTLRDAIDDAIGHMVDYLQSGSVR